MVVNRQGRDLSKREKDELREMLREVEIFKELVSSMVTVMGGQRGRRWAGPGWALQGKEGLEFEALREGFPGERRGAEWMRPVRNRVGGAARLRWLAVQNGRYRPEEGEVSGRGGLGVQHRVCGVGGWGAARGGACRALATRCCCSYDTC